MDQVNQSKFAFLNDEAKAAVIVETIGKSVAKHALVEIRQPLRALVRETVESTLSRELQDLAQDQRNEQLLSRIEAAIQAYFEPIRADFLDLLNCTRRREQDDPADWWKWPKEDEDDDE